FGDEFGGKGIRGGAGRRAGRLDPVELRRRLARAVRGAHRQSVRHLGHGLDARARTLDAEAGAARPHAADARADPRAERLSLGGADAHGCLALAQARAHSRQAKGARLGLASPGTHPPAGLGVDHHPEAWRMQSPRTNWRMSAIGTFSDIPPALTNVRYRG